MTTVELTWQSHVARVAFRNDKGVQLLAAAVRSQLGGVLDEIEARDDCRVVVFEAEGRTFIAGADIGELRGLTAETAEQTAREGQQLMQRIARLNVVTLAAVHAACAGGGCELALACDLRMAAASARIGLPETSLGLLPGWGGTVRAVRLFGGAAARRIVLCGELFAAADALRIGLVDSVTPDDRFRAAVQERIDLLLARGPAACREAKRLIAGFEGPELDEQLRSEAAAFAECYAGGQAAEGLAAFLEKRPARWAGSAGVTTTETRRHGEEPEGDQSG